MVSGKMRPAKKERLAAELNVQGGDVLRIIGGKGKLRLEIPRHLVVKREKKKASESSG